MGIFFFQIKLKYLCLSLSANRSILVLKLSCKLNYRLLLTSTHQSIIFYQPTIQGYFNLLQTNIISISIKIGLFVDIHDFDYSLNQSISKDSISKYPLILVQIVKKSFLSILIINRAAYDYDITTFICLTYALFGIIYSSFFREFHLKTIRILQYTLLFLLAITSIFCLTIRSSNIETNFHILFLVIVPLVIKVAIDLQQRMSSVKEKYLSLLSKIQKKNVREQIYYIQDLIGELDSFNHFNYFQNPNSIILEQISCAHIEECKQMYCFCQETVIYNLYKSLRIQIIQMLIQLFIYCQFAAKTQQISLICVKRLILIQIKKVKGNKEKKQQKRKDHLILHIDTLFREILHSVNGISSVHFYYINFLVDQANSKAHTLFQIQRLKHEFPKTSILFRVYFQYMTHKIKKSFKLENTNQLGDIVGLVFEEHLRVTSQIYESSLYQKLELLSYLNNDHINTVQVQNCCLDLYQSRALLKSKITFLQKLNPSNEQLNIIKNGYTYNFCFVLSNESNQMQNYIDQNYRKKVQNGTGIASSYRHNLFENDSCVLFLSAELSTLGNILKGQRSFEDMFGINNYIGKNIHSIIPSIMVQEHQSQIKQYLYNSEKKYSSITYVPLALAKNSDNFAVPVNIRATIDHVSAFDKIGFVCTISLNYHYTNCILVQKDTFNLQLVSKQFYQTFLSKSFDQSEISHLNASKIFPQLPIATLNEEAPKNEIKEALMILPAQNTSLQNLDQNTISKDYFKSSSLSDKILKWSEQEIYSNTKNFIYYHVQLEIQSPKNTQFPCFVVSVKSSQRVTNMHEIQPLIHELQQEYAQLNQQSSNFDIETLSNIVQSTRIGNSENFHFNDHNSLAMMRSSHSQMNLNKITTRTKTLYPDSNQNRIFEELLSAKNEQRDSPFLSVTKRSHLSLLPDKNLSPHQSNHEFSHSIFQDAPLTNRQTDRENQTMTSRQNLEFELSRVLFSSPKQHEDELLQMNERKQIKQLPDKFWKSSTKSGKQLEKSQNKAKTLSRDIIKRLQAYQEAKQDDNLIKRKGQDNLQQHSPNINLSNHFLQGQNTLGFSSFKSNIGSSLHNLSHDDKRNDHLESVNQVESQNQDQQLKQKQQQQQFMHEVLEQQVSFNPQAKNHDGHSSDSNQAEIGQKIVYQQSSLVSSSNSTREALKQVERKIMTTQSSLGLRILNLFGLISVLSISLAIILQGQQITQAFNKAAIDFNFVSWPMDIASTMSQIQLYTIEYFMVQLYLIPNLSKRWKTYETELLTNISTLNTVWTSLWMNQVRSDQKYTPYFYDTINREITWQVNRDKKSYKGQQVNLTTSQFYFVQNYLSAYKSYLNLLRDDFNQQAILIENYKAYFAQASQVKQDILDTSIASLESITSNAKLLMVLCISLSLCMIISIFPIYAYLLFQNEQIFKLMSTLNANSIIYMSKQAVSSLSTFQYALQQYKYIVKSTTVTQQAKADIQNVLSKELPIFTDNQKQFILKTLEKPNKKKTISTIQPLNKFSFNLLFVSVLVFALIITLPTVSYLLIGNFQTESILNVKVLNSLYDLKNSFSYSLYLIIGVVYNSIENTTLYKGYFFAERVPTFFAENAEKLSIVLQIVSESSAQKRFHNSDYDKFFYEILKKDVCTPLADEPEFAHQDDYPIDLTLCKTIRGGILGKGFQTAAKYFFDSLYSVYELTLSTPRSQLVTKLREWETTFDIPNYNVFFKMITNTITILKDFMKEKGELYLSQMKMTQNMISIFEIIILFLLFLFWWVFFYRKMQFEINQNRRLLSLLDIQAVMENTYILTFLSKIKIL